mmetsp:Transcript_63892/g.166133  ORF Transcript_63892/g.166133 Transcript_63892/m.166133 type:complete len:237 (-) Transcript_63892:1227-1937(-)
MFPTVVRKESPMIRRYSSRALVHSWLPPPDARSSPSAMRLFLKQHSTAAVRLPTRRDCLMMASGPVDQSTFLEPDGESAAALASSAAFMAIWAASCSCWIFCASVSADSMSKMFAASSAETAGAAGSGAAWGCPDCFFSTSSSADCPSVLPGFCPRYCSAFCMTWSWSKPSSAGTRWRPVSSNWQPIISHMRPWSVLPPPRLVLSWQYSCSFRSEIHVSNASASGMSSGSLGTTSE